MRRAAPVLAVVLTLSGCGGGTKTVTEEVTVTQEVPVAGADAPESEATLALARKPRGPGEIVVKGNTSPKIFGPYRFKPGGYTFRFEQYEPLDPQMDFREASSFLVSLASTPGEVDDPYQLLVNAEQRKGSNQVTVSGRLYVEVEGDHSYVLRFTPK